MIGLQNQKWKTTCLVLMLSLFSLAVWAANPEISAVGEAEVGGWSVDDEERLAAREDAFRNAIAKWVSTSQSKHFKNYKKVKDDIERNVSDYVLEHVQVNEKEVGDRLKVKVRATLNEAMLLDKFLSVSDQNVGEEYIAAVFVAREYASERKVSEQTLEREKSQTKNISKSKEGNNASITKGKGESKTIRKIESDQAAETTYRRFPAQGIDVAMNEVFTDAQYLPIDAGILEEETGGLLCIDCFVRDFEKGDDVTATTKRDAYKGLKNLMDPVRFFAFGTLTVDKMLTDEVSGLPMVVVMATGKVMDIKRRGANVATVGPIQYTAKGKTPFEAKNKALKEAGKEVASKLVAQLSSKGIR